MNRWIIVSGIALPFILVAGIYAIGWRDILEARRRRKATPGCTCTGSHDCDFHWGRQV